MKTQKVHFKNQKNLMLSGKVYIPNKYNTGIIFLHGFPAHGNYLPIRLLCRALTFFGFLTMRFSFAGTGDSEGNFEEKLLSDEVKDVQMAVAFLRKEYHCKKIVLLGHSGGAVAASLYAAQDKNIQSIILLGGISDLKKVVNNEFTKEQRKTFKEKGHILCDAPGKWYHGKKLKKAFYDEFFTLPILPSIKKYKGSILIIHGDADLKVPPSEARSLYKHANEPKKIVFIKNANHSFTTFFSGFVIVNEIRKFLKEQL